jgi:HD domain
MAWFWALSPLTRTGVRDSAPADLATATETLTLLHEDRQGVPELLRVVLVEVDRRYQDHIPVSLRPFDPAEVITADQVENIPESSARSIREAVHEFESQSTAEARCARDADELERLFQALEYRDLGVERVQGWIDSSMKALGTKTAQRIAEAALATSPLAWRGR